MVALELVGGQVAKAGMRAHGVVVLPPRLNDDLSFAARTEPFDAQALVAELAVEGFVGGVKGLPGSMMAVSIRASVSHFRMAWLTNSGPLSERR